VRVSCKEEVDICCKKFANKMERHLHQNNVLVGNIWGRTVQTPNSNTSIMRRSLVQSL
jgi:hypothetical protein